MKKRGIIVLLLILLLPFITAVPTCEDIYVPEPNAENSLDITFLIDGSFDTGIVRNQINDFVELLINTNPFNEFSDKINIRFVVPDEINDLGCCLIDSPEQPAPTCNHVKVIDEAVICPETDEIIIFSSNGNEEDGACFDHGGVAGFGQHSVLYNNLDPVDIRDTSKTILHEIGHSMAFLDDEYNDTERDSIGRSLDFIFAPNCEKNPILEEGQAPICPKWRNVQGTGCFQGCTYDDWYRPTRRSLMRDHDFPPSPVDIIQFRSAINRYVNYVQEPATIEIHPRTEDFIIQKFLENNNDWIVGTIPNTQFSQNLEQLNNPTDEEIVNTLIDGIVKHAIAGLTLEFYNCHDYRFEGEVNPEIAVKFNDMDITHRFGNNMDVTFDMNLRLSGQASLNADGEIIGFDPQDPLRIVRSCDDLLEVSWDTEVPFTIIARLHFAEGPLGIVRVDPRITEIIIPERNDINFEIDDESLAILGFMTDVITSLLDQNQFTTSYNFASNLEEDIYSYKDEFNANLDEFGFSLKASMDILSIEQLANIGKPHGMILDLYAKDTATTRGVEIATGNGPLRISGMINYNTPPEELGRNKHECVQDIPLNFNPIDYSRYNRVIGSSPNNPFVSLKFSQTYINWFIATLFNDGYFCSDKTIPVSDNPDFVPFEFPFRITEIRYELSPLNPPYVNFETLEDINNDGIIDINHDVVSSGEADINLFITFESEGEPITEEMIAEINYLVPFVLAETESIISGDNPSLSQSSFRSDIEKLVIEINNIQCISNEQLCTFINSNEEIRDSFIQEIKENIASHMDRALHDIQINPVRDIGLDFGTVGEDYFTPGINLSYGEYVGEVITRNIEDKWLTYEFNLRPKCPNGCNPPSPARIIFLEEVFYKYIQSPDISIPNIECAGNLCKCTKQPNVNSQICIDYLISAGAVENTGGLHHFVKVGYDSLDDLPSYNFNLINWNTYRDSPGRTYYVYLAEENTYNRLLREDNFLVNTGSTIHKFTVDATQVIAFKSQDQESGVLQDLECIGAVIVERSPDMLSNYLQPVLIDVEERLRSDVNDLYVVCDRDEYPEDYDTIIFPAQTSISIPP